MNDEGNIKRLTPAHATGNVGKYYKLNRKRTGKKAPGFVNPALQLYGAFPMVVIVVVLVVVVVVIVLRSRKRR